jgi:ferric-dicitrate binding protein FerR (iron transport regulator)
VASVRGTRFQIQQTFDIGWVSVYEGCLQVTDDARQLADAVRLCTGEETFVRRGYRPEPPMPIQAGQDGYRGVLPSDGERAPRGLDEDRGAALDATREAIREAIRDVIRTSATEAAFVAAREIAQEAASQAAQEAASQAAQGGGQGGTTGGGTVLLVPGGGGGTSGTVGGQILTPGPTPDCGVRGTAIQSRGLPTGCRAGPK